MKDIYKNERKLNKKKVVIFIILPITIIIGMLVKTFTGNKEEIVDNAKIGEALNKIETFNETKVQNEVASFNETNILNQTTNQNQIQKPKTNKELEWNLTLVNSDNKLSDNYKFTLKEIANNRKFDSRAIEYIKKMLNDIRLDGITDIWVQSSYRSIEEQQKVYNAQVLEYKRLGNTEEQSQILTEKVINKPGYSEHNIGLAVDFNYVDNTFANTKAYKWLKENAEDYGFILRYPKEKESITKVEYEPWHWRYVGKEDAKKMNELGMCLEEYIDYLIK